MTSILKSGVDKSETSRRAYADIDENVPMEELFLSDDKTINKRVLQDEEIEEIKEQIKEQVKEECKQEYKQDINKIIEKFIKKKGLLN